MYPRNSASPERVFIGAVVQISDGAVQTSGVSVTVTPQGGSETAGGGTVAYSARGGVWYTPTQAETNYASLMIEAGKTGCIPVGATIITTASATPGTVLLAPVTHTSAVVPTVTTLTNLPAITSNWLTAAGIASSALNGKGDWNIGKTGYTLSQSFPSNFSSLSITAGGLVTLAAVTHTGAVIPTVTTLTGHTAQTGDSYALANGANGFVALKAQTAAIEVDTQDIQSRIPAALVSGRIDASVGAMAANVMTAAAAASDLATELQSGLATAANLATVAGYLDTEIAAILADTNELQTDWANGGRLDLILDARASQTSVDTIDGIVDSILIDTAEIGAAGAGLSAVPWNAAWDAEVQSEVQDAIEVNHLDHLLAVTYDPASKPGAADALLNELVESDAGVARFTANALEQAPTGGSAPTAAAIADAVWDEAMADHLTSGTTGASLNGAGSAGDPWTTALPGAYGSGTAGKIVGDNLNATISSRLATAGYTAPLDAAGTRTAVGLASANLDTQLADLPTNAELATALGTADDAVLAVLGAPAGASLAADVAAVKAQTAAIETDTAEIGAAGAGLTALASASNLAVVAGYLDTEIAAIKSDTAAILLDTGTDGVVVADKTGFRLSATGVNDIVRTALTEGYAADGATFTLEQGVYMIWSLLAERTLAGTALTAKKLDGSTTAMTFTLDDGTTPTSQTRTA